MLGLVFHDVIVLECEKIRLNVRKAIVYMLRSCTCIPISKDTVSIFPTTVWSCT